MKISRRFFLGGAALSVLLGCETTEASLRLHGSASVASGFNGKKLQTNPNFIGGYGDYAAMNLLLLSSSPSFGNNASAPVTPDLVDANGYLNSQSGNAASGMSRYFYVPTQQERPGNYILYWANDGTVSIGNNPGLTVSPVSYTITSVTQSGGIQTVTLSVTPAEMVAGQPISLSLTGASGTWAGFSGSYSVLAVNIAAKTFTINTGTTYVGTAPSSGTASHQTSTSVQNGTGGLNGSGRCAYVMPITPAGQIYQQTNVFTQSIQSTSNYPNAMVFCHINDEASIRAGGVWSVKFLQTMANFGVIRFHNWQGSNSSSSCQTTTWSTRKPLSYSSWGSYELRQNIYGGHTTLSGSTYSLTAPSINSATNAAWTGALQHGTTVTGVFDQSTRSGQNFASQIATFTIGNANISAPSNIYIVGDQVTFGDFGSAIPPPNISLYTRYYVVSATTSTIQVSATSGGTAIVPSANSSGAIGASIVLFLNVGSSGARPIYSQFSTYMSDNSNDWPIAGTYQSMFTVVYNAVLGAWLKYGGGAAQGSVALNNGVPYEAELGLCAAVAAHPYWTMPYLAVDTPTDFLPSLAAYCRDNKPAWMTPRFEGPNETWNTSGAFYETFYADAMAAAYGWGQDYHNWYGKALSNMGQAASQVLGLGNLGVAYQLIGGVQTVYGSNAGNLSTHLPRFASNQYVAGGVGSPSITGPFGVGGASQTITFSAVPACPNSITGPTATQYVSHLCCANYITSNVDQAGSGPQTPTTVSNAFAGSQFLASAIVNGAFSISQVQGATPAVGDTIFCPGILISAGKTIASIPSAGNYILNDTTINIMVSQFCMTGRDLTQPHAEVVSLADTVINGTVSGSSLTVNSITSGNTVGQGLFIYGGTIAFGNGSAQIIGGAYPNFTLSGSPGNQTASFSVGCQFSLTGSAQLYQSWATWANANFGLTKMCAYEGGYSNDYGGTGVAGFDLATGWSKQDPSLQAVTKQNFDSFRGVTGLTGEYPSVFNTTGTWPISDAWSVLDDIYQNPVPPQWSAIAAY